MGKDWERTTKISLENGEDMILCAKVKKAASLFFLYDQNMGGDSTEKVEDGIYQPI